MLEIETEWFYIRIFIKIECKKFLFPLSTLEIYVKLSQNGSLFWLDCTREKEEESSPLSNFYKP